MATQYELLQRIIQEANINIVTCGDCGEPLLHELDIEEITCPHCGYESEPCDFPDMITQQFYPNKEK